MHEPRLVEMWPSSNEEQKSCFLVKKEKKNKMWQLREKVTQIKERLIFFSRKIKEKLFDVYTHTEVIFILVR